MALNRTAAGVTYAKHFKGIFLSNSFHYLDFRERTDAIGLVQSE